MVFIILGREAGYPHHIPGVRSVNEISAAYVYATVADAASAAVGEENHVAGLKVGRGHRHAVI
jgi:hypothetical protein